MVVGVRGIFLRMTWTTWTKMKKQGWRGQEGRFLVHPPPGPNWDQPGPKGNVRVVEGRIFEGGVGYVPTFARTNRGPTGGGPGLVQAWSRLGVRPGVGVAKGQPINGSICPVFGRASPVIVDRIVLYLARFDKVWQGLAKVGDWLKMSPSFPLPTILFPLPPNPPNLGRTRFFPFSP